MQVTSSGAAHPALSTSDEPPIFTVRSVLIGALLTAFLAWLAPVSIYRLFSSRLHYGILPPGVVALSFLLLIANLCVSRVAPRSALSAAELIIIVAMMWLGTTALFQLGAIDSMISIMAAPNYFASAENRWAEYYLRYFPAWVIPSDHTGAVRAFYNGLPPGRLIPWDIWIPPFFWWGSLLAALLGVVACTITIVHEQWHDHEKLTFPMADIPLALVGGEPWDEGLPAWVRSRLFWVGAGIPFGIISWNILNWFSPLFPRISFSQDEPGINVFGIPSFYTKLDFFTVGLAYFAPLPVLRGFWIGRLLIGAEMNLGLKFGFSEGANKGYEPWSEWGTTTAAWQCAGCLIVFVIWGFWVGREHFRKVLRSAVGRPTTLPDRMCRRYRAAVWGLAIGFAYMGFWFHTIGMSWPVICILLPLIVVLNLGISKLLVEASLLYGENPVSAQTLVMQTIGTAHIPQVTMASLALSYVVFRANAGMMMPQVAFSSRMGDEHRLFRGKLYAALGVAVLVAVVTAVVTVVVLAYRVGAYNFPSLAYRELFRDVYDSLARKSDDAFHTDPYRLAFLGIGMALMALVLWIRSRFAGFWLHPVGLTFATTSVAGLMMINIFLAWATKATLGRLGGIRLVNRARPFFLGLVCGHSLGVMTGILVDAIWFPGRGHYVLTGW